MRPRPTTIGTRLLLLRVLAGFTLAAQGTTPIFTAPILSDRGNPQATRPASNWIVEIQPMPPVDMPGKVDSNSPAYWSNGELYLINSTGSARVSHGVDQFHQGGTRQLSLAFADDWPAWIEAVWPEGNGTVFAWYHQEQPGVCPHSDLVVPRIGAAVSFDAGESFRDLGVIVSSGDAIDCAAENGYFAGGSGDFSVILDGSHQFFYILFSNYGGLAEDQGVAVARIAFADRHNPSGRAWKYFHGGWSEPGVNGRVTPIFAANASWHNARTDAFWGPSVHWNTYLQHYVVLLNHACCSPGWPQDGVFISFNADLSNPSHWTEPQQIVNGGTWYPQVIGLAPGETDRVAGQAARFYMYGHSDGLIVFRGPGLLGGESGLAPPSLVGATAIR